MPKRTGKENVRATRSSSSHNSSNTNSGSASKKAVTRQQSEPLVQLHEDEEQNARTEATKVKRRRVGNALAEEEGRKTQTRSRRQAVRADDEDDVDMETEEGNNDDEGENTVEEDADDPLEQTASEQEDEENDAMEQVEVSHDENEDPDAARDLNGDDKEVGGAPTETRTSSRNSLSRKSSLPSSPPKAPLRRSSHVSSTVSDNGSTTSGNGKHNATRREKRKGPSQHTSSSKISPTSAQNLFQFTCRLLQSQKLEFEVRAREFEEKNAQLAAERHKWEKKIRGVKRQLQALGHPVDGVDGGDTASSGNGTAVENGAMLATNVLDPRFRGNTNWNVTATTTSLTTTGTMNGSSGADAGSSNSTHLITMRDAFSSRTSAPASSSTSSGMDSLIPVSIHHMEAQIQDTLRLRRQQMGELMKDLHGIHGLNDKITRLR
ncbi:hypothetical protein FI667_g8603, partial [Globisporangium splendens]